MGFSPLLDRQDEINLVEYVIGHLKNKIEGLESSLSFMMEIRRNLEKEGTKIAAIVAEVEAKDALEDEKDQPENSHG